MDDKNIELARQIKEDLLKRKALKTQSKRHNLYQVDEKQDIVKVVKTNNKKKGKNVKSDEELRRIETNRQNKAYKTYLKEKKKNDKLIKKGKRKPSGYRGV